MNNIKRVFILFLSSMLLLVACESKDTETEIQQAPQSQDVEIEQVVSVATSFWSAIQNSDAKSARVNIHSPSRAQLGMLIEQDIEAGRTPPIPDVLEFDIEINGETAIAVIRNSDGVGCDLIKEAGRWWVYPGQE